MRRVAGKGAKRTVTKGSNMTEEQRLVIYSEIEDMLFCQGMHRDAVIDALVKKYQCVRETGRRWVRETCKQWRKSYDSENLAERHYQLDRMAHNLYATAITGVSPEVQKQIDSVIALIKDKKGTEAIRLLTEMKISKNPDLRIAQRVLWNLCAMSGYGNKITVDVSASGLSVKQQED